MLRSSNRRLIGSTAPWAAVPTWSACGGKSPLSQGYLVLARGVLRGIATAPPPLIIHAHRHSEPLLTTLLARLPQERPVAQGYVRLRPGMDLLHAAGNAEYQPPPRSIWSPCHPAKTSVEYRYAPGFSAPQTPS